MRITQPFDRPELVQTTSWGAIIAGVITTLSIIILLSFLSTGLGFSLFDSDMQNPGETFKTAFGLSSSIIIIVSMILGGFVAGRLAGKEGFLHGFLNWALTMLIAVAVAMCLFVTTAKLTTSTISSAASLTGQAANALADGAGDGFQVVEQVLSDSQLDDINFDTIRARINQALYNTQIPSIQPQRLERLAQKAKSDIADAVGQIRQNPSQFRQILFNLSNELEVEANNIKQDISQESVVNALVNNGLTQAEAEQATQRAMDIYDSVSEQIEDAIYNVEQTIDNIDGTINDFKDTLSEGAEQAANLGAHTALIMFIAGLVSAVVSSIAGFLGARTRNRRNTVIYPEDIDE